MFITRGYEPKALARRGDVEFVQTRWSAFYRSFSTCTPRTDLLNELLNFMEEHNMSQSNRFTTIDLLALSNFPRARKLMDATMWESIHQRFLKIAPKTFWKESAFTQLRNYARYVMAAGFGAGYQFEVLLGYWMDQDIITEPPWLGVKWHINPKAPARQEIVSAMEDFSRHTGGRWQPFDLTNEKVWGGMYCGKDLTDFFVEEDHVKSITELFERLLDDVVEFKNRYPKLPWTAQKAAPAEA